MKSHESYIKIELDRLKFNFKKLKALCGSTYFCAVVKANAYGHGLVDVAKALKEFSVENFAVARLSEAQTLRDELGFGFEILLFSTWGHEDIKALNQLQISPVVSTSNQLQLLKKDTFFKPVHLEYDTGMHRLGLQSKTNSTNLDYYFTHFLEASDENTSKAQLERFEPLTSDMALPSHAYSTSALAHREESSKLGCRLGLGLYGYGLEALQPVLSWHAPVVEIKSVKKDETVSYGGIWTASKDSKIAILPVGYADGYRRELMNNFFVLSQNKEKLPVVGAICMDYLMVDVTESSSVKIGEEVTLLDEGVLSAEVWAEKLNTISYEILCGISTRVNRIYL